MSEFLFLSVAALVVAAAVYMWNALVNEIDALTSIARDAVRVDDMQAYVDRAVRRAVSARASAE